MPCRRHNSHIFLRKIRKMFHFSAGGGSPPLRGETDGDSKIGTERTVREAGPYISHSPFLIPNTGGCGSFDCAVRAQDDSTKYGTPVECTDRTLSCHSEHTVRCVEESVFSGGCGSFDSLRSLRMTVRRTGRGGGSKLPPYSGWVENWGVGGKDRRGRRSLQF